MTEATWTPAAIPPWDGKTEVSIIVPFCNEGQNVIFTAQSLIEELEGFCKYEILLIDNQSDWYINCSVPNENMPLMHVPRGHLSRGDTVFVSDEPGVWRVVDIAAGDHAHEAMVTIGRDTDAKMRKTVPITTLRVAVERPYTIRSRAFFQGPPGSKRDGSFISTWFFRQGIVKYLQYDDKQGHWNAKNHGIANSKGKFLFFVDAHCIMKRDSLRHMIEFLRNPPEEKIGGVHAYINYMLDARCLEYRPQKDKFFGYQFCSAQKEEFFEDGQRLLRPPTKPYKVCVMSTCGMMCPRTVIEELGGWHPEFGIYCGGEGYMNFKQSTCGYHHWIHPQAQCWHWAEKRGYQWNHGDYVRNEQIAAYVCGGERALEFCIKGRKSTDGVKAIAEDVRAKCAGEQAFVESRQVEGLEEYFDRWIANPGVWK